VRIGNWLTAEEGKKLLCIETTSTLRGRRNRALLSLLIGCGLRRGEVTTLRLEDLQLREGHWVIADLRGKGGHIRTIPVPQWVKEAVDSWTVGAGITSEGLEDTTIATSCRVATGSNGVRCHRVLSRILVS
jgi:integrase